MQLLRADSELGAEPELLAVHESGGGVDEHRGCIDLAGESRSRIEIAGDDRFAVARPVTGDVLDRRVERRYDAKLRELCKREQCDRDRERTDRTLDPDRDRKEDEAAHGRGEPSACHRGEAERHDERRRSKEDELHERSAEDERDRDRDPEITPRVDVVQRKATRKEQERSGRGAGVKRQEDDRRAMHDRAYPRPAPARATR